MKCGFVRIVGRRRRTRGRGRVDTIFNMWRRMILRVLVCAE